MVGNKDGMPNFTDIPDNASAESWGYFETMVARQTRFYSMAVQAIHPHEKQENIINEVQNANIK